MSAPRPLELATGLAVLFSRRSPDKETPNEDVGGVFAVDAERGVLVVADGLGGQPAGASASRIVLDSLDAALGLLAGTDRPVRGAILDALESANERLLEQGVGAATTFAALEVDGGRLRPYHVGDSGILVVGQRGKVKLQTVSHSPVGYAVEAGLLDEHEALHHDERHLVSNMVGAPDMRIEVGSPVRLAPRDTAIVASDGLFDNLGVAEVVEIIRAGGLERAAAQLVRACGERMTRTEPSAPSKPDDLTFVLYRPARRER